MIDHNHIIDLLPAYALKCLDDDEAVMVAEHLAACEKCHSRLTDYRQSVDLLAHETPRVSPPDKLKIELMRRIYATLNAIPGAPGKSRQTPPPMAASILVVAFFPGMGYCRPDYDCRSCCRQVGAVAQQLPEFSN